MINKEVKKDEPSKTTASQKGDEGSTGTAPQVTSEELSKQLQELKAGFSRLGNKEKELEKRSKDLDTYVKDYPRLLKVQEEYEALRKALVQDPYAAYKNVGGNPQDATTKMAASIFNDNPQMHAVQSLTSEVQKLQQKLSEVEKARTEESETKKRTEFVKQLEKVAEEFPIIHNSKSYAAIEAMVSKLKSEGTEDIDLKEAAKLAENHLKDEIKKLVKTEAIKRDELLEWLKKEEAKAEEKPVEKKKNLTAAKKAEPAKSQTEPSKSDKPRTLEEARRRAMEQLKKLRSEKQTA